MGKNVLNTISLVANGPTKGAGTEVTGPQSHEPRKISVKEWGDPFFGDRQAAHYVMASMMERGSGCGPSEGVFPRGRLEL